MLRKVLYIVCYLNTGIISILDEECLRPGSVSDISFLGKMDKALANHAHYMSHQGATTAVRKSLGRDVSYMYALDTTRVMA